LRALEAQLARDLNRTALHALDQVKTIERESLVSAGTQARCTIDYVPTTVAVRLRNILPSLLRQPLKNFPAAVVCALVPPSIDLASQSQSILTVSGGYLAKASAKAFVLDNQRASQAVPMELINSNSSYELTVDLERLKQRRLLTESSMAVTVSFGANDLHSVPVQPTPTCSDGIRNQHESDVDCGGPCNPCAAGRRCDGGTDCRSTICGGQVCRLISLGSVDSAEPKLGAGGSFEQPVANMCPGSVSVAYGFGVKRGTHANLVQLFCRALDPDTGTLVGEMQPILPVGHDGGADTVLSVCPDGRVLKGVRGTGGGYPLEMQAICVDARMVPGETPSAPAATTYGAKILFQAATDDHQATCGVNEVVVGARARFGEALDQLILTCRKIDAR